MELSSVVSLAATGEPSRTVTMSRSWVAGDVLAANMAWRAAMLMVKEGGRLVRCAKEAMVLES